LIFLGGESLITSISFYRKSLLASSLGPYRCFCFSYLAHGMILTIEFSQSSGNLNLTILIDHQGNATDQARSEYPIEHTDTMGIVYPLGTKIFLLDKTLACRAT
jgi:hypothetical protein